MLIKTRYLNLPHGCDFLCFKLMNYYCVWERYITIALLNNCSLVSIRNADTTYDHYRQY